MSHISSSSSNPSSSTLLLLLLHLPPPPPHPHPNFFLEISFLVTFHLTLPLMRKFCKTRWWAALAQQAQCRTCGTNRPILPGCLKKVGVGIYYRSTKYKYSKIDIYQVYVIALVYTIDIPRISYKFVYLV